MIDWISTPDSGRTVAIAYLLDEEAILTRFPDGTEWRYDGCPPSVWAEFSAEATSKGAFIRENLNHHPNRKFVS
jgi:KTSC domain